MHRHTISLLAICACASAQSAGDGLFEAVRANNLPAIRTALEKGTPVDSRDRRGNTPLMEAAAFGTMDSVDLLVNAHADVNAHNSFDATALLWGAADERKVRLLLDHGADVNAKSKAGRTPLMVAAASDGSSTAVRLLLAKGADAKAVDAMMNSPLSAAAAAGDAASVKLLLDAGADPNSSDGLKVTPLMLAVESGNVDVVRLLLAKGANARAVTEGTPMVKFGAIQYSRLTPLMLGVPFYSAAIAKALVDAGAEVNARDIRGMTPLMLAVATERPEVERVRILLKAGADTGVKDETGATALDWAMRYGNGETLAALKAVKAKEAMTQLPPKRPAAAARTPAQAVDAASALLARTSAEFFKQSGCVGCHHQAMSAAALVAARGNGAQVDEAALRGFIEAMASEWARQQENFLERLEEPGAPDGSAYFGWAMKLAGYKPNGVTDAVVANLAAQQHQAGNWHVGDISRAPVQESDIARTARMIRVLKDYSPAGMKEQTDERVARASRWIAAAKLSTNDDAAMQLVGLFWAGEEQSALKPLASKLIAAQRKDGGWPQNPYLASDAFATGETLWALRETGTLAVGAAQYQRGVKFLLDTQWPDGAWFVRSRAPRIQPYFQSGFPFEHDQWVSSAGTAWAVLALAPAMEKEKR